MIMETKKPKRISDRAFGLRTR